MGIVIKGTYKERVQPGTSLIIQTITPSELLNM